MLIDCLYFTKVFFNGICKYVCPDMQLYFFSYLILSAKVEPRSAKVISHSPHLSCVCDTLILFSLLWLLIVHQATMPKTEQPELFSSTLGINLIINEPKSSKITNILDFLNVMLSTYWFIWLCHCIILLWLLNCTYSTTHDLFISWSLTTAPRLNRKILHFFKSFFKVI